MIDDLTDKSAEFEPAALIDAVLKRTGYGDYIESDAERGEERLENIRELQSVAKDFLDLGEEDLLTAFLERVSLVTDADNVGESADAVTLITLHQAKGLEFSVVFIVGMEEGMLCPICGPSTPATPRKSRRNAACAYVGVTRAKERLYLGSRIPSRLPRAQRLNALSAVPLSRRHPARVAGQTRPQPREEKAVGPTRRTNYSNSLDARRFNPRSKSSGKPNSPVIRRRRRAASAQPQGPRLALNTGDRVRHKTFGEGIVTEAKPARGDTEVTVAFKDGHGVKRLLLSFAPLEKVE